MIRNKNILCLTLMLIIIVFSASASAKTIKLMIKKKTIRESANSTLMKAKSRRRNAFIIFYKVKDKLTKEFETKILSTFKFNQKVKITEFIIGAHDTAGDPISSRFRINDKELPTVVLIDDDQYQIFGRIHFNGDKKKFWKSFDEAQKNKKATLRAWKKVEKDARLIVILSYIFMIIASVLISTAVLYVFLEEEYAFLLLIGVLIVDILVRQFIPYGLVISGIGWLLFLTSKKGFVKFLIFCSVSGSISYGFLQLQATGFISIITFFCKPPF